MVVVVVSGGQVDSKTSISQMLKTSSRLVIEFLAEIVLKKIIDCIIKAKIYKGVIQKWRVKKGLETYYSYVCVCVWGGGRGGG